MIVISGVMGGGKTTLINELHKKLPDSKVISFDDYSIDQLSSSPEIDTPIADAVNQYDISLMMEEFHKANADYSVILIDFPFGNKHLELLPFINQTIYIQTPLDIVLARQVKRDYKEKSTEDIIGWMKQYLNFARPIFIDFEKHISASADYILDGTLPLSEQVEIVSQFIESYKERKKI